MTKVKQVLKFLMFLALGLTILYLIYNNQQEAYLAECAKNGTLAADCSLLDKIILDFKSAQWKYVVFAIIAYMFSCIVRAVRWNMLTKPMGYPINNVNAFGAVMIGYLANMALPRVGEFVRAGVISRYEEIPTEKAFGTIITERVVDALMLLLVMGLGFVLESEKIITYFKENSDLVDKVKSVFTPSLIVFLLGLLALMVFLYRRNRKKIHSNPVIVKVRNVFNGLKSGVLSIKELDRPFLFVFYSIVIWAMYYFMTYIAFKSFGPTADLDMQIALMVFLFGSLGVAFPSPGGMGSYHFLVMQVLGLYGVGQADGFSFANIIFFGVNIGGNVVFGILSLLLLPLINKTKNAQG